VDSRSQKAIKAIRNCRLPILLAQFATIEIEILAVQLQVRGLNRPGSTLGIGQLNLPASTIIADESGTEKTTGQVSLSHA
jgi:hypothetical protein